ncbi:MAG TPA: extracellular solute-binding protein [Acidisphaera sp.]|nr:extracellular solute-binding protein [Acidisphaera sp.]
MESSLPSARGITRRSALKVAAGAAALPFVHIRTAGAAGKLAAGFWDHWVPGANDVMRKLVAEWADKNKVDVSVDFITSVGNKNLLTLAAESQAGTGHDLQQFPTWEVQDYADKLEPMDDVVTRLSEKYGKLSAVAEYLSKVKGHFMAVPAVTGTQNKPGCGRIDTFKEQFGIDLVAMCPVGGEMGPGYDKWTWDAFLEYAPKVQKIGQPWGMPMGQTTDAVDWVGGLFRSYGAVLVNEKGEITVKSDAVRTVLEYMKKLAPYLPADMYSWDDASNNRALISGKSALIFNPPSAWAVAVRDNRPVGEQCWTFPNPAGPKGRFVPHLPYFWGSWKFAPNKSAAKELIEWLSQREQAQRLCQASKGYDLPPFDSMHDFKVWEDVGPPKGTVYNYPVRPQHHAEPSIAAFPAPPEIAIQIYNQSTMTKMIAKVTSSGQTIDQAIDWAQGELEGFTR